jgi:DDE domain
VGDGAVSTAPSIETESQLTRCFARTGRSILRWHSFARRWHVRDGHRRSILTETPRGIGLFGCSPVEDARGRCVEIRARRYLNNIVEQDHRAVKRRCAPMLGLKSFRTAALILSGIEPAHRIRKRQYTVPDEREGPTRSLKELWTQVLSSENVSETSEDTDRPLTHQISFRSPSAPPPPV